MTHQIMKKVGMVAIAMVATAGTSLAQMQGESSLVSGARATSHSAGASYIKPNSTVSFVNARNPGGFDPANPNPGTAPAAPAPPLDPVQYENLLQALQTCADAEKNFGSFRLQDYNSMPQAQRDALATAGYPTYASLGGIQPVVKPYYSYVNQDADGQTVFSSGTPVYNQRNGSPQKVSVLDMRYSNGGNGTAQKAQPVTLQGLPRPVEEARSEPYWFLETYYIFGPPCDLCVNGVQTGSGNTARARGAKVGCCSGIIVGSYQQWTLETRTVVEPNHVIAPSFPKGFTQKKDGNGNFVQNQFAFQAPDSNGNAVVPAGGATLDQLSHKTDTKSVGGPLTGVHTNTFATDGEGGVVSENGYVGADASSTVSYGFKYDNNPHQ
jgi:hypothetical protein